MDRTAVILVVDDDPNFTELLKIVLREVGYTVVGASTGREALACLRTQKVDLMILDWILPDLGGAGVCQAMRTNPADQYVPIMGTTIFTDVANVVRIFAAGADDLVYKQDLVSEMSELLAGVQALLRRAQRRNEQRSSDAVTMHFNFPEAVKVACQQYLLYFVEFLKDVGIDALAELREDAGQVLFSVTPTDNEAASDNIREALEIYLRLPMNRAPTVDVSPEKSIEVQKLSAQLQHLQGQFYLASAALQQKELTIQERDTTIGQQQALIQQHITTGKIFVEALQEEQADDPEPLDSELHLDTLDSERIKVKRFAWEPIPIELNLPELIRLLKKRFNRKQLP